MSTLGLVVQKQQLGVMGCLLASQTQSHDLLLVFSLGQRWAN